MADDKEASSGAQGVEEAGDDSIQAGLNKEEGSAQSLGWHIRESGEYMLSYPMLTPEEESLIFLVERYFREITRIYEFKSREEVESLLHDTLLRVCDEQGLVIDEEQEKYLVKVAYSQIYGLAFFEELLADDDIEEIAVIGLHKPVYVYIVRKGWLTVNVEVTSIDFLAEIINKMAKTLGRRITLQNPRLDTTLPDGSRLHASLPPISEGEMTIRKFKSKPLSLKKLISFKALPSNAAALLSFFIQGDFSLIVAGNTASGKTTLLNALFAFFPMRERILITEETPEIKPLQSHTIRLLANKDMGVSLMDLVYDSLRMRPDRVIVGEVRNAEESRALFDVLLGGQARGAYATFHGKSADEVVKRLVSFGIPLLDINSIDAIVVQRRMLLYKGEEKELHELRRMTEFALVAESKPLPVLKYNVNKDTWEVKHLDEALAVISERMGLRKAAVKKELERREKLLEKAPEDYKAFFNFVQKEVYHASGDASSSS